MSCFELKKGDIIIRKIDGMYHCAAFDMQGTNWCGLGLSEQSELGALRAFYSDIHERTAAIRERERLEEKALRKAQGKRWWQP